MFGLMDCFRLCGFMVCPFNSVVVFMMFSVGVLWLVLVFPGCCGCLWFVLVCLLFVYGAFWGWVLLVVAGMSAFWAFYGLLVLILMFCRCC